VGVFEAGIGEPKKIKQVIERVPAIVIPGSFMSVKWKAQSAGAMRPGTVYK
jgi:hypothetical protein